MGHRADISRRRSFAGPTVPAVDGANGRAQPRVMILEINAIDVRAGDEAAFEAAFARCAPLLLRVRGCRAANLLRCVEQPGRYLVRVEWERLADHVDHYPSTPEAAEVRALLRPLIARAEPAHFESV